MYTVSIHTADHGLQVTKVESHVIRHFIPQIDFFFSRPLLPTPDFPFQCRGFVISFDHTERHTTVGLLWTRDRLVAEVST
jgi:hypothetical protein